MPNPMHATFRKSKAKKGQYESVERFVRLTHQMLKRPAWQHLRPQSKVVYIEICFLYNGANNGRIGFSLAYGAQRIGASKSSVQRALKELEEHGFIKRCRKGYFMGRQASEYAITDFPLDGRPPTREWREWKPIRQRSRRTTIPNIGIQTILNEQEKEMG